MKRRRLQQRPERFKLHLRGLERCVEFELQLGFRDRTARIGVVKGRDVDSVDGRVQRVDTRAAAGLARVAGREGGKKQSSGKKLLPQIVGIWPVLGKLDAQRRAAKLFGVDCFEQLDRNHCLVAGPGVVKQHDRLQVVAHGHAAAVEVENLRHGAIGFGVELEPDARAGQVVAMQCLRDLKGLAKPDRIGRRLLARGNRLPSAFVQIHRFAVRQIARVHLPCAGGQFTQAGEPVNYGARCRRQIGTGLGNRAPAGPRQTEP